MNAEIFLFHAYSGKSKQEIQESKRLAEDRIEDTINSIKNYLNHGNLQDLKIHKILRSGDPLDNISTLAKEIEPDLILISTSSIGDKVKRVLGSRSYQIIRSVEIPVLSLPDEFGKEKPFPLKIGFIVGIDAIALRSFERLLTLSAGILKEIHLIELCPFGASDSETKLYTQIQDLREKHDSEIKLTRHLIDSPDIINSINKLVELEDIDLLSVSMQKKKFISRILFPGIMKQLYFNFEVPMLVFHS